MNIGAMGSKWRSVLRVFAIGLAALAFSILVLLAGYFIGRSDGFFGAQEQGYSAQYRERTRERVDDCFRKGGLPSETARCVEESITAGHENQRAEGNLDAQRESADWAWWLLVITMVQTPITALGILLLLRNIQQGDSANEISRQAMTAENRAWMEIKVTSVGDLRYVDEDFRLTVKFRVKNIGKSVALNVSTEASLIAEPTMGSRTIGEVKGPLKDILERLKQRPSQVMAQNIFPGGQSPEQEWDTAVRADDVQLGFDGGKTDLYPLCLVLSVQYSTIFDGPEDEGHRTVELGYLRKIDERGWPGLVMVGRNPVGADFLRLVHPTENLGVVT